MITVGNSTLMELRRYCLDKAVGHDDDDAVVVERAKAFEAYILRDAEVKTDGE